MRAFFICYRRDDAEGQAGRLFDDLTREFGENAVFMDVESVAAGRDFRKVIEEQIASCGVLLVVIGKGWLDARDESGARRIEDALDFVRLEIASALKRDIPVVPVLVQGARMPRKEELPGDLAEFAFRNGVELTHARWDSDLQRLIKSVGPSVGADRKEPGPVQPRRFRFWVATGAALLVTLVVAMAGYAWHNARVAAQLALENRQQAERRLQEQIAAQRRVEEERRREVEAAALREDERRQAEAAAQQEAEEQRLRAEAAARREAEQRLRAEAAAQRSYPLTCRGGGQLRVARSASGVQITFQRARGAVTAGLAPGQCTWSDRALGTGEPAMICDDAARAAGYLQTLNQSDQHVILQVYNDGRGCMRVTRVGP